MKDDLRNEETIFHCEDCGDICKFKQFETREGKFADVEFGDKVCKLVNVDGIWTRDGDVMSACVTPSFSVDMHDKDGDVYETGIYLSFGAATVRVCDSDSIEGFDAFIEYLQTMKEEIGENLKG